MTPVHQPFLLFARVIRPLAIALLLLSWVTRPVGAQQIPSIPSGKYFVVLDAYHDGDLTRAFQSVRQTIAGNALGRTPLEMLCYHALAGECLYQMGDLPAALEQYTAALRNWQAAANFMTQCSFPTEQLAPDPSVIRPQISWTGRSGPAQRVRLPPHFFITVGGLAQFVQGPDGQKGMMLGTSSQFRIEGLEILRCAALALRRRAELLGPLAKHDPMTGNIINVFGQPLAQPNHYSMVWVRLLSGLALLAADRPREAQVELQASLAIGGMHHPLTCVSLLELGKLALREGQPAPARQHFLDATFSAAEHQQWNVLAEAFRYGMLAHLAAGDRATWPPLPAATAWIRRARGSRLASVSMFASLAENLAAGGQSQPALAAVAEATRDGSRRSVLSGVIGGRLMYQSALANYQLGNSAAGEQALGRALPLLLKGSRWNYQTGLADSLYAKGVIGARAASDLYEQLLRDPTPQDWLKEPSEALAALLAPNELAMEHWFELALERKEWAQALEISDLIRRRRFFRSLPLGGRLVALRWIAEAPETELNADAIAERQVLTNTRPAFAALSKQAAATRDQLDKLPLDAADGEQKAQQKALLEKLYGASQNQEMMLRAFALDRVPSQLVFPPRLNIAELQQKLTDKQALLSYFTTSNQVYGFVISKADYFMWKVASPRAVRASLTSLLKNIGCRKANFRVPASELSSEKWKEDASKLRESLFPADDVAGAKVWESVEEVVIVPDGVLWYLPFELLPTSETNPAMLVETKKIRYTPLISLAWPAHRPRPLDIKTGIVAQRVQPEDTVEQARAAAKLLADSRGGVAIWESQLPGPSALISSLSDQLIVWSNLPDSLAAGHGWSPMLLDRRKPGSTMIEWLALPWGGPRQIALPGFHTPAEAGIGSRADGSDLFLAACALMADGCRTAIISRWTVGGQSTRDLIRETMQELPHTTADRAWHRAVQLLRVRKVDPATEPRINGEGELISADHPLLWSGYLLIDVGDPPR